MARAPLRHRMLRSQIKKYLCLHGVGILKLVDQEIAVSVIDIPDQLSVCPGIPLEHVAQIIEIVKKGQTSLFTERLLHHRDAADQERHGGIILELLQLLKESAFLTGCTLQPFPLLSAGRKYRSQRYGIMIGRLRDQPDSLQVLDPIHQVRIVIAPAAANVLVNIPNLIPRFPAFLISSVFQLGMGHQAFHCTDQLGPVRREIPVDIHCRRLMIVEMDIAIVHHKGNALYKDILCTAVKSLEGPRKRLQFFSVFPAADLHILLFVDCRGILIGHDRGIRRNSGLRGVLGKNHAAEGVNGPHEAQVNILKGFPAAFSCFIRGHGQRTGPACSIS